MRILLMAFLLACAARAEEPKPLDFLLLAGAEALIIADTLQSLDIRNHCHREYVDSGCTEADPFVAAVIGKHPSDTAFIAFGTLGGIGTAVLWYNMPQRYRWLLPSLVMLIEGVTVAHNASMGLRLHF